MKKSVLWFVALLIVALAALPTAAAAENPRVAFETSKGRIVLELDAEKAPETVASFLDTVRSGWYSDTICHRVIKAFMVQCGGFDSSGTFKQTDKTVKNEADNGLKNTRGTVAMARKNDPHSASVQFFINHADNKFLDHKAPTPRGWGYAVFGKVVEGMDVVDAIAEVSVRQSRLSEAQPLENVVITRAAILGDS
jgi:peptidyl-prolyl cis-trans isomerase B (cyclophilin B)